MDIRRVRLDETPPRLKVARDDSGLDNVQGLPQSLKLSPAFCLRKGRIQGGARVVGGFGAQVNGPSSSSSADARISARTANGHDDDAFDICFALVAVEGVLLLDLEDALGGIVDEDLVFWDAAFRCWVSRLEEAVGNPQVAMSKSIPGE